jgi:membrane associated rhomboid family serine protease
VDCVREQAKNAPVVRTVFGGRLGGRAVVTQTMIGICVIAFVGQLAIGGPMTDRLVFVPALAIDQPWRFLTSAFLHLTTFPLHILFNLYALWLVGPYLEGLLGRLRFAMLYLISALGGSAGFFLLVPAGSPVNSPGWWGGVLGASGAVFGLFAALLVVNRRLGRDTAGITAVIGINVVLGFLIQGIAWQAHFGGALTGAAIAFVMTRAPREQRNQYQLLGTVSVLIVLGLLVAVKVMVVPSTFLL